MPVCNIDCGCTVFHQETLDSVRKKLDSDQDFKTMSDFFKILNDFTRLKILESIKDDELCVCDLAHLVGVSKSAISHQMKLLKHHQMVASHKKGKMVYYHLKNQEISTMIADARKHIRGVL
ncbi:MAG: winged helix-turn-helix transcriptional regulator [Acholeplasmataceae bacterium]|nr:winged helix-turn-helix transcriptional regulator [Acholeplasmataceae bacterium]